MARAPARPTPNPGRSLHRAGLAIVRVRLTAACGSATSRHSPDRSASAEGIRAPPRRCKRSPPFRLRRLRAMTCGGCGAVPGQDGLLDTSSWRADDGDSRHRGLTCRSIRSRQHDAPRRRRSRPSPSRSSRSRRVDLASGGPAATTRQPRPVGDHRTGLAERQPQRQQHALPRGRDRSVPACHRGLKAGAHTIRIQYDFTAGGHKAYDFLATYTAGCRRRCAARRGGVSSMCPSMPDRSSAAFPSDGFSTDGLTVRDAEDYSGVSRRLTIWGGTIGSISGPSHAGSTDGQQHRGVRRPLQLDRVGRPPRLGWPPRPVPLLEPRRGGVRDGAARSRVRRGTCARSSSTVRATRTKIAASSRAPSSASSRRAPSRPRRRRRHRGATESDARTAPARPDPEGGHVRPLDRDRRSARRRRPLS